jgi:hypothetical protein
MGPLATTADARGSSAERSGGKIAPRAPKRPAGVRELSTINTREMDSGKFVRTKSNYEMKTW